MKKEDILALQSMPAASASYGRPPCRFINREFFTVTYESDPETIRQAVPEPLEPDGKAESSFPASITENLVTLFLRCI